MLITAILKINLSSWGKKSKGDHYEMFIYVREFQSLADGIALINHLWNYPLVIAAFSTPHPPEVLRGNLLTPETLAAAVRHVNPEIPADEPIPFKMPAVC